MIETIIISSWWAGNLYHSYQCFNLSNPVLLIPNTWFTSTEPKMRFAYNLTFLWKKCNTHGIRSDQPFNLVGFFVLTMRSKKLLLCQLSCLERWGKIPSDIFLVKLTKLLHFTLCLCHCRGFSPFNTIITHFFACILLYQVYLAFSICASVEAKILKCSVQEEKKYLFAYSIDM